VTDRTLSRNVKTACALVALALASVAVTACSTQSSAPSTSAASSTSQPTAESSPAAESSGSAGGAQASADTMPDVPITSFAPVDKLEKKDVVVGTGPVVANGETLSMRYVGWLPNGTKFDSTGSGPAFEFVLGQGQVIQGWDQGVAGMRVGGTRVLTIPPELGYGEQGAGAIPPNSCLRFEVKVVAAR
jgi:FKBP-type peptidyl-prolyl cis-trans isomerase